MSNFECTVTIADIYGAEWWERNKEELEREWEWGFGVAKGGEHVASVYARSITPISYNDPRIIIHRRKPKQPTLREVYGVDEVNVTPGMEWAGEWTVMDGRMPYQATTIDTPHPHRLMLRERPKKVWFKAEADTRVSKPGDYIWMPGLGWEVDKDGGDVWLCATRHEEVDQTVQVVTQAMVDGVVGR